MRPDGEPGGPLPIDPHALLRHARRRIAAHPEPVETDYRRAVSDAYYAIYHALTALAASLLASSDDPADAHQQVRRFRHWHVRDAAEAMKGSTDAQAHMLARAILELHGRRMDADYDYFSTFTHAQVDDLIDMAAQAVEVITAPAFAEGDTGQAFPRLLAAMPDAP